jgi:hypothetical protein
LHQLSPSKIRAQLKMSESTLRRALAFAFDPIASMCNRIQEAIIRMRG